MSTVTIITPTYRRDMSIVRRCVGSVLLQTYQDWEQVVCSDGGREDLIAAIVEGQHDPRLKYRWLTEKKQGDYGNVARQKMLLESASKYVVFLDDDNIILPEFLSKMVFWLESTGRAVATCSLLYVYNPKWGPKMPVILDGTFLANGRTDPAQMMVRRKEMTEIGWDTEGGYNADGVTIDRIAAKHQHVRVPEILSVHL